jgi:hypothetical protein
MFNISQQYSNIFIRRTVIQLGLTILSLGLIEGQTTSNVIPLAAGNQWTLRSPYVTSPVVMQVQSDQMMGDKRRVVLSFGSLWGNLSYILNPSSTGVGLEGVIYNGATSHFEDSVGWFGTSSPNPWSTPFGQVALVSTTETVQTSRGQYQNCWHYQIGTGPSAQHWYLAPGVGFVQFGMGPAAFVLETLQLNTYAPPLPATGPLGTCPLIGIDSNPPANTSFSYADHVAVEQQTAADGARFLYLSASWAELETSPNTYAFTNLQNWINYAASNGFSVGLTVRTVDSNQLSLPADLQGRPLNDAVVISRFKALLTALAPSMKSNVKWVNLANEVNIYFSQNLAALVPFQQFFAAGYSTIKTANPSILVGMVFSYSAYWYNSAAFAALSPSADSVAFTYYPIHQDFSIRPPSVATSDVAEMAAAAGSKPLIITEIGYPSSPVVGSSPALQQAFYSNVYDALQKLSGRVAAASFYQWSDMPAATVSMLVQYYSPGFATSFGAFLGTLGIHDQTGAPKSAESTFSFRTTQFLAQNCSVSQ